MRIMKSTALHSTPSLCLPGKAVSSLPSCFRPLSANGFLQGDGILALCPSDHPDRNKRVHFMSIRAAVKKQKPPPKPASRNVIIATILVPLLLAGSAFGAGKILMARLKKEAREEAEELERRLDPQFLLTDGKSEEEREMEKDDVAESVTIPSTRNRPKREE